MLGSERLTPTRRALCAALVAVGCVALAPAVASGANVGGGGSIQFVPSTVHVGDSGTATIGMTNDDQSPNEGATNIVCNAGDACPTGGPGADLEGISVIPTCQGLISGTICSSSGRDPDVYQLAATASGVAGTSCAGTNNFAVARVIDVPDTGRYNFTPIPTGSHVQLVTNAAQCLITVGYTVLKLPKDAAPATVDRFETISIASHQQINTGISDLTSATIRVSDASQTVLRANPTITTLASPDIALGGSLTDQATVSGLVSPVAGATVTFNLYPPSAGTTCTEAPPVHTVTKTVALSGTTATVTSDAYTPQTAGTYYWIATYNGDTNNSAIKGLCNAATETRNVTSPAAGVAATPPPPAAPYVCTPPPGPAPAGGKLCARGTAAIKGTTGCAGTPFRVVVRGSQISNVTFTLDGKKVRTLTKPNRGSLYVLPVNPRTLRIGVHRVLARTTFRSQSGTRARTLRVTFSKCARRATSPAFTG